MVGNVTCQALLLFPAAIKAGLNTLVKERPAQQPLTPPREASSAQKIPSWKSCKPTSNTSDHTFTAHETTRLALASELQAQAAAQRFS